MGQLGCEARKPEAQRGRYLAEHVETLLVRPTPDQAHYRDYGVQPAPVKMPLVPQAQKPPPE